MMSLFSNFDLNLFYSTLTFLTLGSIIMSGSFYGIYFLKKVLSQACDNLCMFFSSLKPLKFNKSSNLIFVSLFFTLVVSNIFSVFPYNFPVSSQVSFILIFSLGSWVGLVFFSLLKNIKGFFSHFIPEGAPLSLTLFLFLIELISSLIRPLTLTIRLVANILAGHLLMTLLSSLVFLQTFSFIMYVGLNLVEMFVAFIQAYIFCTMMTLYFSEV